MGRIITYSNLVGGSLGMINEDEVIEIKPSIAGRGSVIVAKNHGNDVYGKPLPNKVISINESLDQIYRQLHPEGKR